MRAIEILSKPNPELDAAKAEIERLKKDALTWRSIWGERIVELNAKIQQLESELAKVRAEKEQLAYQSVIEAIKRWQFMQGDTTHRRKFEKLTKAIREAMGSEDDDDQ